jgi:hypothetical protein
LRHLAAALVLMLAFTAAPTRAQLIGDRTQITCGSMN